MYYRKVYEKLQKYRSDDFESQSNSNEWKTMLESILEYMSLQHFLTNVHHQMDINRNQIK